MRRTHRRSFGHDLEGPVLDEEREVVEVMFDPAHLDDADVPAYGRAHADIDLAQSQVDDRVREELLHAEVGEARRVPGHLRDQERRRIQVPQLLKELEDLVPRTLERGEGVEGVEAVERDQVAPHLLLVPGQLPTEPEQPPRLFPDLLNLPPQRAHVDHMDALRLTRLHPERGHLRDERRAALFHGQVEPGRGALLRLMEEDAVHERRFQGTGRTPDEDDVAARDAAAEASVQAHHVGGNLVRSLRQRWNPSRPRQETARCERLADVKMLSRQSPEDARTAKSRIPELHTDPCTSSFGRWSWGTVSDHVKPTR